MIKFDKYTLDCLNIIYSIAEIKKPGYKELDVFILSIKDLNIILKTMIFIDSKNEKIALIKYLYIKFSYNLKDNTN